MLTLEEGSAWLNDHVDGRSGATARQLLRDGIAGALPICVPLDTRAYSPTLRERQDTEKGAPGSGSHDAYLHRLLVEAPAYEMLGLFVVPPRYLLTLETEDSVLLEGAWSLDGADVYFPNIQIRRDQLRVIEQHLRQFAARLEPKTAPAAAQAIRKRGGHEPALDAQQQEEVRAAIKSGEPIADIAARYKVSRRTIDKYKPGLPPAANAFQTSTLPTRRHKLR